MVVLSGNLVVPRSVSFRQGALSFSEFAGGLTAPLSRMDCRNLSELHRTGEKQKYRTCEVRITYLRLRFEYDIGGRYVVAGDILLLSNRFYHL